MEVEFEETDLRLGLPGGGVKKDQDVACQNISTTTTTNVNGKRNFPQTLDLKLNLASKEEEVDLTNNLQKNKNLLLTCNDPIKPPAKAQVVGWPPVRSFRKNILTVQKSSSLDQESDGKVSGRNSCSSSSSRSSAGSAGGLVKVSMDGAPYLRKVDLKMYKTYGDLSDALANMFHSFTIGKCESQGMMDFMNKSKLIDLLNSSDYVSTYEDKDGDWMLVGDVPWEMFVESCKRLRIMKAAEAKGLVGCTLISWSSAPRTLAKCKSVQKLNV